jgi:c-di-GMP-binding flagellar brake protein YcgR
LELPIEYRIYVPSRPEATSPFLSAQLCDLSESGMGLLTNVVQKGKLHIFHPDPATSEQCHLEIRIPDREQTLTLIGRAVWYDRNPEGNPYTFRLGIAFVDISAEDRRRIQSLIHRQLALKPPSASEESSPLSSR